MATEETDHENGENTGDNTEHETTKRPRRRFPGESPDTAPTAQVEADICRNDKVRRRRAERART